MNFNRILTSILLFTVTACGPTASPLADSAALTQQAASALSAFLQQLKADYPAAFAVQNKLGGAPRGDAVVAVGGIRGEWPEFKVVDDIRFECLNYPDSWPPMTADEFHEFVRATAVDNARAAIASLTRIFPDAVSDTQVFGSPKQGDIIVKQPDIRGEWPEFVVNDEGRIACFNYSESYAEQQPDAFRAYVGEVASALGQKGSPQELLVLLRSIHAEAFSSTNILGQPATGDVIVKEAGIRGEWPEFYVNANDEFQCTNYPGSYDAMTAQAFDAYVMWVVRGL